MSNAISVELAEFLVSAADESSGEIGIDASYSGRCMYGQTCLGLTFENIQSAFGLVESLRYFGNRTSAGQDFEVLYRISPYP